MKKKKVNILVSGSSGQLGSELKFLSKGYKQLNFSFKISSQLDLSRSASIKKNLTQKDFRYFINCGAYTKVDHAEKQKALAMKINGHALEHIAQAAHKECKIIHISTDYVYHQELDRPLLETDKVSPKGIYAKTKLEGEKLLMKYRPDSIVLRTSWLYSSFGHNFVKTMLRLGREKERLNIVNDQYGTPTYVRDLAQTIIEMILSLESDPDLERSGIYNYSNLGMTTWYDFAKFIFTQAKIDCQVYPITTKDFNASAPRPLWSLLSKEKIQQDFHIRIPHWQESVKRCLKELGI